MRGLRMHLKPREQCIGIIARRERETDLTGAYNNGEIGVERNKSVCIEQAVMQIRRGSGIANDGTVLKIQHPIGNKHLAQIMRNLNNADAAIMGKHRNQSTKRFRGGIIELRSGFIENKIGRMHGKHARQRKALLLAARQLRRISMDIRLKANEGQGIRNTARDLVLM